MKLGETLLSQYFEFYSKIEQGRTTCCIKHYWIIILEKNNMISLSYFNDHTL